MPTIKLGKTGQEVTRLGMGTSWDVDPKFVQTMLAAGVRYIDTAEGYENGNSEKTIGMVLERTKLRKDVFLVSKTHAGRNATGQRARQSSQNFECRNCCKVLKPVLHHFSIPRTARFSLFL